MPELSDEELDALVEEATVDAYGDEEQLGGFAVMIEDNLEVPFETTVLGVTVTIQKITQNGVRHRRRLRPRRPPPGDLRPQPAAARAAAERLAVDRRLPALGGWPVRKYQGVKMSWVELDRIVSGEIVHDDGIRRRVAESGRPLRSHATGMSDDDLLAKLRGLGVDADREKLAGLCDGALSAEEVVSERLRLHDWDADWAWICLTELWRRWWPGKACLELLDDKVQEGYDADQRNDFVASGRIWLGAWSDVLRMCDAIGARSIRDFDDRFPMTQSLFNWCQDLEMALQNGGEHDSELRTARLEMAAEWLRRFPTEDALTTGNFRRALAGSYFETGHQQKADELYQSWLDDDPGWGWGWIGWADCYTPYGPGKTQDYARAEEILRRGYVVTGVREAEHIAERLADVCGRTGRPAEATEFRRQAEKDRQRAGRRVTRATARAAPAAPAGESRAAKQHPAGKTGRNQPCPCGSGKKFKKCCGAPASA